MGDLQILKFGLHIISVRFSSLLVQFKFKYSDKLSDLRFFNYKIIENYVSLINFVFPVNKIAM